MLLFILSAIFLSSAHAECEYGRASGLFKHGFTSTVGTDNFAPDTGEDANAAFGNTVDVTFTNAFKIFSTTPATTVKIHDDGLLLFSGTTTTAYDGSLDVFNILNQAFATSLWFKDDSGAGIEYRFKYKHIKASSLVSDGLDIGHSQSKCDLQRIVNIIGDCTDNGWRTATDTTKEALIVTWEISDGTDKYYFQSVLAVLSNDETYILFLYDDPANIPAAVTAYSTGYISGSTAATPTKNAAVCPYSGTLLNTATTRMHKQSNCRCGGQNEGIYTFKTNVLDPNKCEMTRALFDTECGKNINTDTTTNFDQNCRPPRNPQDSCLELVSCINTASGFQVSINVMNPPHADKTSIRFLDQDDFNAMSQVITENTSPQCEPAFTLVSGTTYTATVTLAEADVGNCEWTYNSGTKEISFIARLFDNGNVELERAGNVYLKATCDVLPMETSVNIKSNGIPSYNIPTPPNRRLEMYLASTKIQDNAASTKITSTQTVPLGQGLFIVVAYDWGTATVVDKIQCYGVYVYDCKVANNVGFLSTGTNRMMQLTDPTTGCVKTTNGNAFHMSESFKSALKTGSTTVGIVSDTDPATFNFAQSSGSFEASKWLVGGSDNLYFQCKAKCCSNQAFLASSKCSDVCGNHPNVDFTVRRRRDVNTTMDDPNVTLHTSVRIERPAEAQEEVKCVSNVLAYSTMLGLTVLLLVAMGVTLMLFVKLQARQRKRV